MRTIGSDECEEGKEVTDSYCEQNQAARQTLMFIFSGLAEHLQEANRLYYLEMSMFSLDT